MKSVLLKLLALLLVGSSVYYIKNASDKDALDTYISEYKTFKAQADSANHFADSLKTQIVIQENEARIFISKSHILEKQVTVLKSKTLMMKDTRDSLKSTIVDSTEMARKIIPVQDSIIVHQDTVIHKQGEQITNLMSALTLKDSTISLLTLSRDSLQTIVRNIPPPPKNPNKFMGFSLPSRTVVGATAFVVGVVASFTLHR